MFVCCAGADVCKLKVRRPGTEKGGSRMAGDYPGHLLTPRKGTQATKVIAQHEAGLASSVYMYTSK